MGLTLMDKGYIFILVTDNNAVVFTPLVAKDNVQLVYELKDGTSHTCPESLAP